MSCLHHHPNWGAMRADLNHECLTLLSADKKESWVYPVYHPRKAITIATMIAYSVIVDRTLENIRDRAFENRNMKPGGLFSVNPSSSLQDATVKILPNAEKGTMAQIKEIIRKTGLSLEEYIDSVKRANAIATEFFRQEGNPLFSYGVSRNHIEQWWTGTHIRMLNLIYDEFGLIASPDRVDFQDEELACFNVDKASLQIDPALISCLNFALLKTKELRAKEIIFGRQTNRSMKDFLTTLREWNYRAVKDPDEGDLVVYVDDKQEPAHVGYVNSEGLVHSKLGCANPLSHAHRIFEVMGGFGTTAIFFRKSVAL